MKKSQTSGGSIAVFIVLIALFMILIGFFIYLKIKKDKEKNKTWG